MVDDVRTLVLKLGDRIDHNGEWYPSCEAVEDYLADVLTAVRQEERERCAALVQRFPNVRPDALAAAIRRGKE